MRSRPSKFFLQDLYEVLVSLSSFTDFSFDHSKSPPPSFLFCFFQNRQPFPLSLPFSQTYPLCCMDIRSLVDQYYTFSDGFSQHHRDIDDILKKVSYSSSRSMQRGRLKQVVAKQIHPSLYLYRIFSL